MSFSDSQRLPLGLATAVAIFIGGFGMTHSERMGLFLIALGFGVTWWSVFPWVERYFDLTTTKQRWLLGTTGSLVILIFVAAYSWSISGFTSATTPPSQTSSVNQSGGITAGNIDTIVVNPTTPTEKPRVTFGEPTLLNEKTQEGYQTHIPLKVISPFPIGSLSVVVHVKSLIRIDLSSPHVHMLSHGKVENGQAFVSADNVRGDITLVIDTDEPISATNPAKIDYTTE